MRLCSCSCSQMAYSSWLSAFGSWLSAFGSGLSWHNSGTSLGTLCIERLASEILGQRDKQQTYSKSTELTWTQISRKKVNNSKVVVVVVVVVVDGFWQKFATINWEPIYQLNSSIKASCYIPFYSISPNTCYKCGLAIGSSSKNYQRRYKFSIFTKLAGFFERGGVAGLNTKYC